VRHDILAQLNVRENECTVHVASFDRPNIFLKAVNLRSAGSNPENVILNEIRLFHRQRGHNRDAVIIYCGTQKETDKTAVYLRGKLKQCGVGAYHAGLGDNQRKDVQSAFMNGTVNIITATNAFGMGIDKDNVGLIVHKTSPASIEEYYQQIGRAGRNGANSTAVILYGHDDRDWIGNFSQFIVHSDNPTANVVRRVAEVVCDQYVIGQQQAMKTNAILEQTGFSFHDHVTTQTISVCLKTLERYEVLKRIKSDLLPLQITFSGGAHAQATGLRQDTMHWRLWNEIAHRHRDGNNAISVIIVHLTRHLHINSKQLTKSLQYLKSRKLLSYESLKRAGAIVLLTDEFEEKVDWNEVELNRENAVNNERKMKQFIETQSCRRRLLLQHFDQQYVSRSNPRCCDNCHRNMR